MTPEEEMAVIVKHEISYKGVRFDLALPKPIVDHIHNLIEERYSALQSMDRMHDRLRVAEGWPAPSESPWVRVDV